MKILTVIGARPQFIKASTISRVIASKDSIDEVIVHTGQHFDKNMSDIFFEEMQIPEPDYNLNVASLPHGAMTGRMLEGIEKIIISENPDWVLVYGDTNSTLAAALAASKLNIKLAHVEAGLRSHNMKMPEEINRILTDRISEVLFCPTALAERNLKSEGYDKFGAQIYNLGDVMYDAALFYSHHAKKPKWLDPDMNFALATVHRAENTGCPERLKEIILALNEVHKKHPVVLPVHPRLKKAIEGLDVDLEIHMVDPIGYLEMVYLLKHCRFVLSDSGGVQKEAYFFKKRCLVLRDETEWTELVEAGANILVGAVKSNIVAAAQGYSVDIDFSREIYGSGNAADKIVDYIENHSFSA